MRIITGIWLFYKKLIVPSIVMAIFIGSTSLITSDSVSIHVIGFSYLIFALFFHFVVYEIRNPNEYYFYYNLGLSKLILWISTLILSFCIAFILIKL